MKNSQWGEFYRHVFCIEDNLIDVPTDKTRLFYYYHKPTVQEIVQVFIQMFNKNLNISLDISELENTITNKFSVRPESNYYGVITSDVGFGEMGLKIEEFMLFSMYKYMYKQMLQCDFFCIGSENKKREIIFCRYNKTLQSYEISWLKKSLLVDTKKKIREAGRTYYCGIVIP